MNSEEVVIAAQELVTQEGSRQAACKLAYAIRGLRLAQGNAPSFRMWQAVWRRLLGTS